MMARSRARRAGGRELMLELDPGVVAAGGAASGELSGPAGPATVTLQRVEQSPSGRFAFAVSSCRVDVGDAPARFEIEVPGSLPPAVVGRRCRLDYVISAHARASRWRHRRAVAPVSLTTRDRPVHEDPGRLDRVIPSNTARRFHLELVEALLERGGHVSGRVHWESDAPPGGFSVTVACEEAWCTNFRFRSRRSPLLWETEQLWEETCTATADTDRRWSPFRVEIPATAPQAVEGRVIAWRYTVEAVSAARRAFAGRAVLTPLRFEV
jgi:hypothetical protein